MRNPEPRLTCWGVPLSPKYSTTILRVLERTSDHVKLTPWRVSSSGPVMKPPKLARGWQSNRIRNKKEKKVDTMKRLNIHRITEIVNKFRHSIVYVDNAVMFCISIATTRCRNNPSAQMNLPFRTYQKIIRVKATRRRALKGVATIGRSANSGYFKNT